MVYRGKPSAACFLCRERRIKCDTRRPQCSQCTNRSVTCPGYKNPLDQLFRDETESVTKRIQAKGKKHDTKRVRKVQNETPPSSRSSYSPPAIPLAPLEPIEDIAIANFMLSHIPDSRFDYLSTFSFSHPSSPLLTAIHAASLAVLAQDRRSTPLLLRARDTYTRALASINTALRAPSLATQNETLICVLLLGLYEALLYIPSKPARQWTTHTDGALALVRLRGRAMLDSPMARKLLQQVCHLTLVRSLRSNTRMPPDLLDLAAEMETDSSCRVPLGGVTQRIADLLASIQEGMDGEDVIEVTARLDEEMKGVGRMMPERGEYETEWREGRFPFPYFRAVQFKNTCHMLRILLNEILYAHAKSAMVQQRAVLAVEGLAATICASVTQFTSATTMTSLSKPCAASLLWPLFSVRGSELLSSASHANALEQLRGLGDALRMPQAEVLLEEPWRINALREGLCMFYLS
ncbi:hypothetical protein EJ04DRAFT_574574 [Polyplosphaeria fusca]|uniref:Zn(2)-C6 fungal-type domain-containing protein n=1 Tax=Polyplosphaeria fusca TaxID=682080 RepID=A0A9P4R5L1_9PLEO|nr:hypothetical protein EJ04DRAFT_574574 [Polyplosphaeria fusca]